MEDKETAKIGERKRRKLRNVDETKASSSCYYYTYFKPLLLLVLLLL